MVVRMVVAVPVVVVLLVSVRTLGVPVVLVMIAGVMMVWRRGRRRRRRWLRQLQTGFFCCRRQPCDRFCDRFARRLGPH